jgi:outer membrane protein
MSRHILVLVPFRLIRASISGTNGLHCRIEVSSRHWVQIVGTALVVSLFLAVNNLQGQEVPPPSKTSSLSSKPAGAQPLSLDDAIGIALRGHPALREAEDAVTAAEAEVKQARALYFPQLSFSGIGKVGLSGATSALGLPGFPASPFWRNAAYSANWYQNIFDFGRTKHLVASQRALAESARFKSKEEKERVVLIVKRAYFSVLEAQGLQSLAEQTVEERKLTLRRVRASFEQGLQSQMEVSLAEASVAEAEGSKAEARATIGEGFAALRAAMGVDGAPEYDVQAPQMEVLTMSPLEELVQQGVKNRPDAQALDWKVRAFSEEAGLARAERLPKINGFGAGGQGRFNGTTVKEEQRHGVGAMGVFIPIFTGGRLEAAQQEAKAELDASLAAQQLLRQQIRQEVTDVYYQLTALVDRLQAADQRRESAAQALRLAQARYNAQLASFLDVLTAEVGKTEAETALARTQFDYQRARAELEFAIGQAPQP